ncbi:DUF2225 domain-containing protein [Sporosarcina sp. GW1-11]|uniref:DUF2225 domain-containing protein n=1 Tax=Sporosarcina sp. GW1-11 TaxID=2899126 RepID=UPI00294E6B1A|nr:DUF2225 domain-containing protein [Sporosarcina sp. GW1-11]MDV6378917.1 DUF2225 domain-containing protein [Sporosarcina sp. GW1-11]
MKGMNIVEISPFYEKRMQCLLCKEHFPTTRIRSRQVRVSQHDSDFRPIYINKEINPIFYNVAVCPQCGFAYTDDFSPYFGPGVKEKIAKNITAKWRSRSFGHLRSKEEAVQTYKLAYLSANFKKEKHLTIAGMMLRIAWIYRESKETENEMRYIRIARDLYIQAFSEGDHVGTQMSETRVQYLIAELSWRIEDRPEAIRNFSRVIEAQKRSTEPNIIQLAKDRWQEIREDEATNTLAK